MYVAPSSTATRQSWLVPIDSSRSPCSSASTRSSSTETYFVATTTVTPSPASSRTRAYRSRISSGDVGDDPLPSRLAVVAAMREEPVGIAGRADVGALHVLHTGGAERAF